MFAPSRVTFAGAPTPGGWDRIAGLPLALPLSHGHRLREVPIVTIAPAPLVRACFGVACPAHGRCRRYLAVGLSAADPRTMVTCRSADRFPMFLACETAPAIAA